eukprot:1567175-Amphidinium_carterae.2
MGQGGCTQTNSERMLSCVRSTSEAPFGALQVQQQSSVSPLRIAGLATNNTPVSNRHQDKQRESCVPTASFLSESRTFEVHVKPMTNACKKQRRGRASEHGCDTFELLLVLVAASMCQRRPLCSSLVFTTRSNEAGNLRLANMYCDVPPWYRVPPRITNYFCFKLALQSVQIKQSHGVKLRLRQRRRQCCAVRPWLLALWCVPSSVQHSKLAWIHGKPFAGIGNGPHTTPDARGDSCVLQ